MSAQSRELFLAKFVSRIWEIFYELKKRFEDLKTTIAKTKIGNKKVEKINACITLLEGSIEEMHEGIRKFQNSVEDSIKELRRRTISENTLKHLQRFIKEQIPAPANYDDVDWLTEEALNICDTLMKERWKKLKEE